MVKNKKTWVPTESDEQAALYRWINFMIPKFPELENLYHIPNEGKRSDSEGARLKREGLIPGMPDLCLPSAHGGYHALYIEMKRTQSARVTKEQSERIMKLTLLGNYAVICYGWEEAQKVIEWYIKQPSKEAGKYKELVRTIIDKFKK